MARIIPAAVADAQFVREALECAAVRRAAEKAGHDDLRGFEENLRGQERARDDGDREVFYVLDDGFHKALCDLIEEHREVVAAMLPRIRSERPDFFAGEM